MANFHLHRGSPCINAGVAISGINDGYKDAAPDLGAFEFVGTLRGVQLAGTGATKTTVLVGEQITAPPTG